MNYTKEDIWQFMQEVEDPEIPVLHIVDLGIVRDILWQGPTLVVIITPTYSGCPAMKTIERDIAEILEEKGITDYRIDTVLSPAWTTDWMSDEGKLKLHQVGIAPPVGQSADKAVLMGKIRTVRCPICGSEDTSMISQFGSTACKALYRCENCLEPFDHFKCI
jgi:ring-1,2-phenylacetyl-CoA epoxidase subunit PaaD